jgi:hypothetical protein
MFALIYFGLPFVWAIFFAGAFTSSHPSHTDVQQPSSQGY